MLRPIHAWMKFRYRRFAGRYDLLVSQWEPRYGSALDRAFAYIAEDNRRILDAGTGTGYAALRLAQRFPGAQIFGVDLSWEMLREAQKKAGRITWIQANNSRLPFSDCTFDLVIIHNAPLALDEVARVARPNGQILLCFSTGAAIPRVVQRFLGSRLRALGCLVSHWGRAGEGLYLIARRT